MEKLRLGFVLLLAAGCSGGGFDEQTSGDFDRQIDGEPAVAEAPDYITMNEEASKQAGLVASVRLPNQVVEWYAPEGVLLMSEAGVAADNVRPITKHPALQDMLPTELYEFLSKEPAPQVLRDIEANSAADLRLAALMDMELEALSDQTDLAQPALETTDLWTSTGTVTNGCAESWFRSTFCVQGSYTWMSCQPHRTSSYNAVVNAAHSLDRLGSGVCSKVGTLTFRAQFICDTFVSGKLCLSNAEWGPFSVPAGSWRSFTRSADLDPFTLIGDDDFAGHIQIGVGTYAFMVKSRND